MEFSLNVFYQKL